MKNELRIGNWINNTHSVTPFKVSELREKMCYYKYNETTYNSRYENIEPIPLTEEWLLKFGFEDITGVDYLLHISIDFKLILIPVDGFYPQINKADDSGWQSISLNKINYVHELQNLYFALTGEELTIK